MKNNIKVLLADMNDGLFPSLAEAMSADGCMELMAVATTGSETLRLCEELQPDVLLLELVLPELDGLAILEKLKEKGSCPLVIFLTDFATPLAVSMAAEAGAAYFLSKPCPAEIIIERIRFFASLLSEEMNRVETEKHREKQNLTAASAELLRDLGISAQLKGYHYLLEAVSATVQNGGELQMVTKCLYPAIAKRYSTTAARVERSIRHAVETGWSRGDPELLRACFGCSIVPDTRPTNSQFIAGLAWHLLEKEERGRSV